MCFLLVTAFRVATHAGLGQVNWYRVLSDGKGILMLQSIQSCFNIFKSRSLLTVHSMFAF